MTVRVSESDAGRSGGGDWRWWEDTVPVRLGTESGIADDDVDEAVASDRNRRR